MKLVTLIENTTCREDLTAEHGLSLYLEVGGRKLLFDAGASGAFGDNALRLGIDLKQVDTAILSHAHYDHGNGLMRFLEINDTAPVYVSRYGFSPRYNASGKFIGIPPSLAESSRLRYTDGETILGAGLTLHTIPLPPSDTAGMTVLEQGQRLCEDFRHEQYLLIEEKGKKILISGCSHKGILNITAWFRPDVLIGGFHFRNIQDEAFLRQAAYTLLQSDTVYYTGHCTGQMQYEVMKQIMGDRLHYLATGDCIQIASQ